MGVTGGSFFKYPRTPHLFGSTGTSDDRHLGEEDSKLFLADPSLIVEEKLDGANVGIHFETSGRMVLQCRGHEIGEGEHPQFDLLKQWAAAKRGVLESFLGDDYLLFGEWLYAKHSIGYRSLPHYFFEFDIFDKAEEFFLDLETRLELLAGSGVETVPVIHRGPISIKDLEGLIGESRYGAEFLNPRLGVPDSRMEGLYLRTEAEGKVTGRAKWVRPEFIERIVADGHWMHREMESNGLREGVDLWL